MRTPSTRRFLFLLAGLACPAFAGGLPPSVALPAEAQLGAIEADEDYGEAAFPIAGKTEILENVKAGHHWHFTLSLTGVAEGADKKALWAKLKPALLAKGWAPKMELADNIGVTLQLTKPGESWLTCALFDAGDVRCDVVVIGKPTRTLTLTAPAAKAERLDDTVADFPFLAPLAGSKNGQATHDVTDFEVTLPGEKESVIVASGVHTRAYDAPEGVSPAEVAAVYGAALKAAGWSVVLDSHGIHMADALLIAHYAKNGRDVWASVHFGAGALTLTVADAGAKDLAALLKKDCRATLTGIFFDFDKATLKPESDGVLARARDALKANAGTTFEIQGHTDAVGDDAYNLKLSDARAKAVVGWLVKNGVPATQLGSKGYGKGQPVASNDTPEGRAKNRRVEVVCAKK